MTKPPAFIMHNNACVKQFALLFWRLIITSNFCEVIFANVKFSDYEQRNDNVEGIEG